MTLTYATGSWLITGAATGIGAATARQLARAGASVVLAGRRLERCTSLAESLVAEGLSAQARRLDITDRQAVFQLVEELALSPGGLAGAFNNAARLEPAADLPELSADEARATLDCNVLGQLWLLQAQIPMLASRGGGSIVLTGSIAADVPLYGLAPYAASKAALRSLVRSAAAGAFPQGVRVNLLAPGPTHTPMGHGGFGGSEALDEAMAASPAGRGATPDEVAQGALWLLSDQAAFVNGSELVVDGGYSLVH
ncbi:MAG: SDR family oxidoreductase [Myxococcales bacterium]|nr:SDR family oxidoreductase [Myxococcales bacterium]